MRPEQSKLYNTARWRRTSKAQLSKQPLCEHCLERGVIEPATQCDHATPHKGNPDLFWSGPFNSLCRTCHGDKTAEEMGRKPRRAVSADGAPIGW